MYRSLTLGALLLTLLVVVPQHVHAQDGPQGREGVFVGLGLGFGSFGCENCGTRNESLAGYFKLGGALLPNLLLGVEASLWTKAEEGARITHGNLGVIAQFYPIVTSGLFVKGGAGLSRLSVGAPASRGSGTARDDGFGWTAGLGYDIRLGASFSVTPYASYQRGSFDGGSADHYQLGAGASWN